MVPKVSWVTKVTPEQYVLARDSNVLKELIIYFEHQTGVTSPKIGDVVYVVKPESEDRFRDAGVFLDGTCVATGNGQLKIDLNPRSVSRFRKNRYFRFDSLNLKDHLLRKTKESAHNPGELCLLEPNVSVRLEILTEKTDADFDEHDAMFCLLAYEESRIKGMNPESSELTVNAAIESGRLVTSVSSKMLNFKWLDPRVEGGLRNGAKVDKLVWEKYYNPNAYAVNINSLRIDLARKSTSYELEHIVEDKDEPSALPNTPNDSNEWQSFARRIRRGQSRFRKALLILYANKCAFTGVQEDAVLEACHILPHAETGNNQPDNGLILRADIHNLFDLKLATVASDGVTVRISPEVTDPEFSRLNFSKQCRAGITNEHRAILAVRNREISWLS